MSDERIDGNELAARLIDPTFCAEAIAAADALVARFALTATALAQAGEHLSDDDVHREPRAALFALAAALGSAPASD